MVSLDLPARSHIVPLNQKRLTTGDVVLPIEKLNIATPSTSPIHMQLVNNIHSNIEGIEKCGSVSIGTPPQQFTVSFVTDVMYLLVDSIDCICKDDQSHSRYNHNQSSSYKPNDKQFNIVNNTHLTASGYFSSDMVTMSNVQVNMLFGEITQSREIAFTVSGCDGVVGLGFTKDGRPSTVLTELVDKNLIPEPIFGLHFNRDLESENGGELILGGTNTQFYDHDDVHYVNLTSGNDWEITVHNLMVLGQKASLCQSGCNATINTVDPFIIGNFNEVQELNKQLGAKSPAFGIFVFNCSDVNSLPLVSFVIDGYELKLSGKDYVYRTVEPAACFSRFQGVLEQPKNKLVLGNTFIGAYYAIFDAGRRRIGFAKDSTTTYM